MPQQRQHPRVPDGWSAFALVLAAIVFVSAALLAILGYGREALLLLIPGAVIVAAGALAAMLSRRAIARHGGDPGPAGPLGLRDPEMPLGAVAASDLPDGEDATA